MVRLCLFEGMHFLPWMSGGGLDGEECRWIEGIAGNGSVLHDFVWSEFLRDGRVIRGRPPAEAPAGVR